jgi:hypothetical protein
VTIVDRDLTCERCGSPGGVGHWIMNRWCCARCVLLAQLELEKYVPVSPPPPTAPLAASRKVEEFRRLVGLIAAVIEDDFMRAHALMRTGGAHHVKKAGD